MCKKYGGADYAINYRTEGWQKEVLKLTKGKGVGKCGETTSPNLEDRFLILVSFVPDVIYDPVGLIKDSLKCIAWKGRAIVVGFAAGDIEKVRRRLSDVGTCINLSSRFNFILAAAESCPTEEHIHRRPPLGCLRKVRQDKITRSLGRPVQVRVLLSYLRTPCSQLMKWRQRLWESKKALPLVYSKIYYGLEGVSAGLKAIEDRETWGKATVRIRDDTPSPKL